MKKILNLTITCGFLLAFGACSSSLTTENGVDPTLAQAADAATDAVPQANPEGAVQAAADGAQNAVQGAAQGAVQAATDSPPPPAADPAAVPPSPPGNGTFDSYTVQSGDTLMKIAFETYGDLYRWKSVLEANRDKVRDPNHIPAGTVLKVEKPSSPVSVEKNGEKYLIKNGDTLGKISNNVYGTRSKWKTLYENNKQLIHDPNRIFAGFFLYYQPNGQTPSGTTVTPTPLTNNSQSGGDVARAPASAAPAAGTN